VEDVTYMQSMKELVHLFQIWRLCLIIVEWGKCQRKIEGVGGGAGKGYFESSGDCSGRNSGDLSRSKRQALIFIIRVGGGVGGQHRHNS
jgi:hypothetical protein